MKNLSKLFVDSCTNCGQVLQKTETIKVYDGGMYCTYNCIYFDKGATTADERLRIYEATEEVEGSRIL